MAHYFASDVHLRFDHPQRDACFCAWLSRLGPADELLILGDLCDFWTGARCSELELLRFGSLQALASYTKSGGSLSIMAGNHDLWLCPFYEARLGARIITEPYDLEACGLRVRLVHGHHLGARQLWKSWMESRAFFTAFGRLPGTVAGRLDQALAARNLRDLEADEKRHLRAFRAYAASCRGVADIVVVGHVHRALDESHSTPRLIVLGGWQRRAASLKIDETGARFQIECDVALTPASTALFGQRSWSKPTTLHEN